MKQSSIAVEMIRSTDEQFHIVLSCRSAVFVYWLIQKLRENTTIGFSDLCASWPGGDVCKPDMRRGYCCYLKVHLGLKPY